MKAIFLDRDGVINKYPGDYKYITKEEDFELLEGVEQAIYKLTQKGFKIFVISNQAGVSKGLYSKKFLEDITQKMLKHLQDKGGKIEKVFYCIHREEENCNCRKPKTGAIQDILKVYPDINIKKSFFIGDSILDVKTGKNAGCKTILVLSGREKIENQKKWEMQQDYIAGDLREAVEKILLLTPKQRVSKVTCHLRKGFLTGDK